MTLGINLIGLDTMMVVGCCIAVVYGALHDIAVRTVPNTISAIIGLLGLWHAHSHHVLLVSLTLALMVSMLGACAWLAALLGAGDVKLIGAASLFVQPTHVPLLLAATAIAGGLLACLYLLLQRVLPEPADGRPGSVVRRLCRTELWRIGRRGPLPYAVAISSATLFCLVQQ